VGERAIQEVIMNLLMIRVQMVQVKSPKLDQFL